jgi:hypothetical protein
MLTNLRRELRLRLRQAAVLSAGLGIAVGAGLLTTAGPASAAPAAAGHAAVPTSQAGRGGRGCEIRIPARGGVRERGRCCPTIVRRPGYSITVRCCLGPVPKRHGRPIVAGCCPAPVLVRHGGPVTVRCCPALTPVPPPWRHCKVRVSPGAIRRCPAPPPVRCRIHIKPGQGG